MSDAPGRPRHRDQRQVPVVRPVARVAQSAPAPRRSPLLPWLIAGGAVFAGLSALIVGMVLVFIARSERQARDQFDRAKNQISGASTVSALGPPADPQPQPQPPDPQKPKVDVDYFNDKVPDPAVGPTTGRAEYRVDMDEVGNAKVELDMMMPATWMAQIRERMSMYIVPGPKGLEFRPPTIKNLINVVQDDYTLMEDVDGELTDRAVRMTYREIGVAKCRAGRWVRNLQPDPEYPMKLVKKERSQVVTLRYVKTLPGNYTLVTNAVVKLPPGAHDIEVTEKPNQLWYRLPKPAIRAPAAEGKTSFAVQAKPHLLGALAKQYADPRHENLWPARSHFRNDTAHTLTNYRARFRIPEFADWSDWQVCDSVFPGQSVVDVFRPQLDHAKIGELKEAAEIEIEAECEYTGADGLVRASSREPTRILPINAGVFSDVRISRDVTWVEMAKYVQRIAASFVVPNDPVMKVVVDLVCRSTGVALPIKTDKDALAFVKGVYLLMRGNMKWENAEGGFVQGMPYQRLKYGRDVLRDHAGTCANTSIFFASVMEAAGLDPLLYFIPRHCFAGMLMPESKPGSAEFLVIETTGCGKGTLEESAPFDVVVADANKTIQKALKDKMYMEVNVRYMRKQGVVPPELPVIEGDVLGDWGVRMPKEDEAGDARAGGAGLTDAQATVKVGRVEANVTRNGKQGEVVHMTVNIAKAKNRTCEVLSALIDEQGDLVRARTGSRADPDGFLIVATTVRPDSDDADFADIQLFVPYDALPAGVRQKYLGAVLVTCDGRPLNKPDRNAVFVVVTAKPAAADEDDIDELIKQLKASGAGADARKTENRRNGDVADALVRVKMLNGTVALLPGQDSKNPLLAIGLRATKATDDDLALLATVMELGSLDLRGTAITDVGVAHLSGLPELRKLSLANTKVTRSCVVHLLDCPRLAELDVSNTDFPPDFKWNSAAFTFNEPPAPAAKGKWRLPKYYDELGLTDDQKDKVTGVTELYDPEIKIRMKKIETGNGDVLMAATVRKMLNDRQRLLNKILTEEQREKYKELKAKAEGAPPVNTTTPPAKKFATHGPMKTRPSADTGEDRRIEWRHEGDPRELEDIKIRYVWQGKKKWHQYAEEESPYEYVEVARNADFIELKWVGDDLAIRLYQTKSTIKLSGEKEFRSVLDGSWVK